MKIEVSYDHVIINGQKLMRPKGYARSKWMRFWENVEEQSYWVGFK